MGKGKGDERSDRERQGREIQKCLQRLNLSLGVFLCQWATLIVDSEFDYLGFLYRMNAGSLPELRMEPN